jgi:hypothetical protein
MQLYFYYLGYGSEVRGKQLLDMSTADFLFTLYNQKYIQQAHSALFISSLCIFIYQVGVYGKI